MLDNHIKLHLHSIGIDLESKEQGKIKHIISEHYAIELYKAQKEYQKCRLSIIRALLTGLLFLIIYVTIALRLPSKLFMEIVGFIFTFTLRYSFDKYINTLMNLKDKRESITQKLIMDINFAYPKEEESS